MNHSDLIARGRPEPGTFVKIRPCGDDNPEKKTFLGIACGDVGIAYKNPCFWVFDMQRFVFGFESWWEEIDSPEDLSSITDEDINNVWYVRALKALE